MGNKKQNRIDNEEIIETVVDEVVEEVVDEVVEEVVDEVVEEVVDEADKAFEEAFEVAEPVEEEIVETEEVVEEVVEEEIQNESNDIQLELFNKGVVVASKLYVREEPKKDAEPLAIISKDTEVTINFEESTEDFYKVTVNDEFQTEGYCIKEFIGLSE